MPPRAPGALRLVLATEALVALVRLLRRSVIATIVLGTVALSVLRLALSL